MTNLCPHCSGLLIFCFDFFNFKIHFIERTASPIFESCLLSIDGTDCPIQEPIPFSSDWWSHKLNRAGLRYEIGISLSRGYIVWVNGPYPCGTHRDIDIFQSGIKRRLLPEELVLADRGYPDFNCCINVPELTPAVSQKYLARHETCNGRMKSFKSLSSTFRHSHEKHALCFHAVACLTQLQIIHDQPLFEV